MSIFFCLSGFLLLFLFNIFSWFPDFSNFQNPFPFSFQGEDEEGEEEAEADANEAEEESGESEGEDQVENSPDKLTCQDAKAIADAMKDDLDEDPDSQAIMKAMEDDF